MRARQERLAPVVRLAPAKLNLTLAVVGRRADGFHDLHSVAVRLGLADRLSLAPRGSGDDSLHVTGPDCGPPSDNLVVRAIAAGRAAARAVAPPDQLPALSARLEKRIPVAAGLGGGSSDAAAALDGALEAWDVELPRAVLTAVAAGLGSDVPFFLGDAPALLEGRGERVTQLAPLRGDPPAVLLVTPAVAVSTAAVFAVFAGGGAAAAPAPGATRLSSEHLAQELRAGLRSADLVARAGVLAAANDLVSATAALVPALVPFRRAVMRRLGRPVGQSGSGPTLWALYPSLDDAEAAAGHLRAAVADRALEAPGDASPSIVATIIEPGSRRNP